MDDSTDQGQSDEDVVKAMFPKSYQNYVAKQSGGNDVAAPGPTPSPQGGGPPPTPGALAPAAGAAASGEPDNSDYANKGWGDVASEALQNAPGSAMKQLKSVGSALIHPVATAEALGDLGSGALSKAKGALGFQQDPTEKANNEQLVDSLINHYKSTYGSSAGFKKELAQDPFSIGMDAASVVPGIDAIAGGTKVAKVAGMAGKLLDPVQGAVAAAKLATKPATFMGKEALAGASGVPRSAIDIVQAAGASKDPIARQTVQKYASGQAKLEDIPDTAMKAVDELKQQASANYLKTRQGLATTPLPTTKIQDSISEAIKELGPDAAVNSPDALATLQHMQDRLSHLTDLSAVGLDNFKKGLDDVIESSGQPKRAGLFAKIPKATIETISDADPKYADMLQQWSDWRNQLLNFKKEMGANPNASDATRLTKLMGALKTDSRAGTKQTLLSQMAGTQSGQYLPQMLAGASVSSWFPRWSRGAYDLMIAGGLGVAGHPAAIAGLAAGSPKLVGKGAMAAGRLQKLGSKVSPLLKAPATNVLAKTNQTASGSIYAKGGRVERKAGGRVSEMPMSEVSRHADRLVNMVDRVRKGESRGTEPLLKMDDSAVAHALELVNRGI